MAISYHYHHHYNYKLSYYLMFISSIINLLIIFPPPLTYSLSDEEILLEFKQGLGNPEALNSWVPNTPPCPGKFSQGAWNGVLCIEGIITGLRLKSMSLSGSINVLPLSNLVGLRIFSIENNQFSGPIPNFNNLSSLRAIYLSNNQFSDEIPDDYFVNMGSLKKLWLDHNQFKGPIPSSLTQLRSLVELHLESNQFSGLIPPLQQPPLQWLDLSNNKLQGEIPLSLSKFDDSVFEGNVNLCGERMKKDCSRVEIPSPTSNNNEPHKKKSSKSLAIGVSVGVAVLLLAIVVFLLATKRKNEDIPTTTTPAKKGNKEKSSKTTTPTPVGGPTTPARSASKRASGGAEVVEVAVGPTLSRNDSNNSSTSSSRKSTGSSSGRKSSVRGGGGTSNNVGDLTMINEDKGAFGMADLMRASAEVLGNGGLGSAYKAVMANGLAVAVKRMRELNRLEKEEFGEQVKKLAKLRHENVLPPLAYYYRKEEKLLVYEHVSKGSLHHLLHGERGPAHAELTWPVRLNIIKGIARGLQYIHKQLSKHELPHGNLKSSNILIDTQYQALISDYGFDPLASPSVKTKSMFGYRSPEAVKSKVVSPKCDIYCLGVVILEILTGKFPCQYLSSTKNGTDVVQWTMSAIKEGRESGLLDPDMMSKVSGVEDGMVELLHVGVGCTESDPDKRPGLDEIVERIEGVHVGGNGSRKVQVAPLLR